MKSSLHECYMNLAINEAKKGRGFVKTNPLVGAVIVKNKNIISKGYHLGFGKEHAEVNAINNAEKNLEGAVLYVTLEPCSTYGKTPPCVDAIIKKKFKKVVIGTLDPNPKHNSKAVHILEKNRVEVKIGVLEKKCRNLIKSFCVNIEKNRPYVILKLAMTLDGKIATYKKDSKWITNEYSRRIVHKIRNRVDAVLVGKNCVLIDDPELNVRYVKSRRQPDRIVFDSNLEIKLKSKIFEDNGCERVFILNKKHNATVIKNKNSSSEIIYIDSNKGIGSILEVLYQEYNIGTILVEGGSKIATSFIKNNLVDEYKFFYAPKIIGDNGLNSIGNLNIDFINNAVNLKMIKSKRIKGGDFLIKCIQA